MIDQTIGAPKRPPVVSVVGTMVMFYSVLCYLCGVVTLVYLILFIGDILLPITINKASTLSPKLAGFGAVLWNCGLIFLWGLQHSLMARPAFKRIWTRVVPASIERSTYLVFVTLATALLVAFWVPMPSLIWDLSGTWAAGIFTAVYFLGWVIVLFSTFLINHFQLFGL